MNSARSVARFASCRPLKSLLGNSQLVRSQSCCYFSIANHKAAGAAQSKSTFIAEYQKASPLYSVSSNGYSQGPKDGNLEKETVQDKLLAKEELKESIKSPPSAIHDEERHIHKDVKKNGHCSVHEEGGQAKGLVQSQQIQEVKKADEVMASHKAAGAAQSKSTFIAEQQKALPLCSVSSKGNSQESNQGTLEQETVQDKPPAMEELKESTKSPPSASHDEERHIHKDVEKNGHCSVDEEGGQAKGLVQSQQIQEVKKAEAITETRNIEEADHNEIAPGPETPAPIKPIVPKPVQEPPTNPQTKWTLYQIGSGIFAVFGVIGVIYGIKHYYFDVGQKEDIVKNFYKAHHGFAETNSSLAFLIVDQDEVDIRRVVSFVGNQSWELNKCFDNFKERCKFGAAVKKVMYIHGDPGIGKSAAFSAIVHNMNEGSTKTEAALKQAFPFLRNFKHFIYIHGKSDFSRITDETVVGILDEIQANRKEALVVIDDVHLMFLNKQGQDFYEMLNSFQAVKCIVLLSSQAPTHDALKNLKEYQKFNFTELPKIEAILQLHNSIQKNEVSPCIPQSLSRLIAYRLWFYLGGNFRAFLNVFGKQSRDLIYLCKRAHGLALTDSTKQSKKKEESTEEQKQDGKRQYFNQVLKHLIENYKDLRIEDSVLLDFGTPKGKRVEIPGKGISKVLVDQNILIGKQQNDVNFIALCFHSRRAQYSFTEWLALDNPQYWEGNEEGRLKFCQLRERIEFEHVLGFAAFPFKELIEKERVEELDIIKDARASIQKEHHASPNIDNKIPVNRETLDKIVELKDAEVKLSMLYYKAYQEGKGIKDFQKDQIELRDEIKALRLGPAQFYQDHHEIIEANLSSDDGEEVKKLEERINTNTTVEVVNAMSYIYAEQLSRCLHDFQQLKGFDFLDAETREELEKKPRDVGVYLKAKENLPKSLKPWNDQKRVDMLKMYLDLMEEFTCQLGKCDLKEKELKAEIKSP